jgi:uncharacterized phage protein gp47/JayE
MEPSWQDMYDIFKVSAQERRPSLTFQEGDVIDAIACAVASVGTVMLGRFANLFLQNFLDSSSGQELIRLARDRGIEPPAASKSVGTLKFTRPSFVVGVGTIPAGTRVATDQNTVVKTLEDLNFGATDLSKTIFAECEIAGKSGNVAPGTLIRIIDSLFDSFTVTNETWFAGGEEAISNQDLRDLIRSSYLTSARATSSAIERGAKLTPGVRRVDVSVDESGVVNVYVADEEGNSNEALAARATKILEDWRAATDVVYVSPGTKTVIDFNILITVRSGLALEPLLVLVRQAVIAYARRLNPGEVLYKSAVESVARSVDPTSILNVQVISPAANISPAPNESLRIGIVTFE